MQKVRKWAKNAGWWMAYTKEVTGLALRGCIAWATWRKAMTNYPAAVCGPRGSWIVDPHFQM